MIYQTSTHEAVQEQYWWEEMEDELHSLSQNKVWTLVSLPEGKKARGCCWHSQVSTAVLVKSRSRRQGS